MWYEVTYDSDTISLFVFLIAFLQKKQIICDY